MLVSGVYTARKHHTPTTLATTSGVESASDCGGLEAATAVAVTALPTWVPVPSAQNSAPAVPLTSLGLQMKKVVLVGVPNPVAPVTKAWSTAWVLTATGLLIAVTPSVRRGCVDVVVGELTTLKHSSCVESLDPV